MIPSLIWATWAYGVTGAGYAWLGSNAVYFFAWVPLVHRRFVTGLHRQWMVQDLIPVLVPGLLAASVLHKLLSWSEARLEVLAWVLMTGAVVFIFSAAGSGQARSIVFAHKRAVVI